MPNRSVKQTRPQLEAELADKEKMLRGHAKCILKLEMRVEELLIDELAYQTTERQLKERLTEAETQLSLLEETGDE